MGSCEASVGRSTQIENSTRRTKSIVLSSMAVVVVFLWASPNFQFSELQRSSPLGSDFLQEWTGGYIWRSDDREMLYDSEYYSVIQHDPAIVGFEWPETKLYPMVYPPFYYLVVSPFSYLSYPTAMIVWVCILGSLTALTLWMWTSFYPPARDHWGKCTFATIAFFPFLMSFNTAHKSILLLLILSCTFLLLFHKRPRSSGLVFGLIAFKPHLGLLIGISMLLKRQWHFVFGCLLTVAALLGLSLVAGTDLCIDYFRQMTSTGNFAANSGYQLTDAHNLIGALSLMFGPASWVATVLFLLAMSGLVWALIKTLEGDFEASSPRFAFQFSVLIFATILSSPHFYVYDLTIALLPIALLLFNSHWLENQSVSRNLVKCCIVFYAIAGVAARIAEITYLQPTIIVAAGIIYLVAFKAFESSFRFEENANFATRGNVLTQDFH